MLEPLKLQWHNLCFFFFFSRFRMKASTSAWREITEREERDVLLPSPNLHACAAALKFSRHRLQELNAWTQMPESAGSVSGWTQCLLLLSEKWCLIEPMCEQSRLVPENPQRASGRADDTNVARTLSACLTYWGRPLLILPIRPNTCSIDINTKTVIVTDEPSSSSSSSTIHPGATSRLHQPE